jgi:hypothetical protein
MPEISKPSHTKRRRLVFFFVLIGLPLVVLVAILWYTNFSSPGRISNILPRKSGVSVIKVFTSDAGMYEVKQKELTQIGVEANQLVSGNVSLYHRGLKLPVWVEGEGANSVVRFYAQKSDSLYSNENVYLMVFGKDIPLPGWYNSASDKSQNPGEAASFLPPAENMADSYYASLHEEQNKVYQPVVTDGDHWFWEVFAAPKGVTHEFTLDQVSPGPAVLRLSLWSGTQAAVSPDHQITLAINGRQVGDLSWNGPGSQIFEANIPDGVLKESANSLTINLPSLEGVIAEIINLNWFEIVYLRLPVADQGQLEIFSQGQSLSLTGFAKDIYTFDITDPLAPLLTSNLISIRDGGPFFKGENGHRYVVVDSTGFKSVASIAPAQLEPGLVSDQDSADYLVIGVTDFKAVLEPLLERRKSQGHQTMFVPVDAIYDQFGYGYPEPEAIQQFISYAQEHWSTPPKYILLVGDASYDPKGYLAPREANLLPSFFVQTAYGGQTVSDVLFSARNISNTQELKTVELWPDVSIGRIPARTRDQVKTIVDKTLQFEAQEKTFPSSFKVLAVADGQDDTFGQEAKGFISLFPSNYYTQLFTPAAGSTDSNQEIVASIDAGYDLVAYFGHGSITMWGKDRLFSVDDISKLTNSGSYPLFVNMTCLTGLFTHPSNESLTEALLFYPKGGAVQILAPTSLTLPMDQGYLYRGLVEAYLDHPDQSLGEIVQKVRVDMLSDSSDHSRMDVILTFLLFGDPSLQIP